MQIARLLRPRSIAIIGASADPASFGGRIMGALERFHFAGDIHLVNPKRSEINGRPCVPSVDALPMGVDAAILAIPQAATVEAIAACARRDVGAAVVLTAGFSETGEEGKLQQKIMTETAREAGIALVGPNCIGLVNYANGIPLTSGPVHPIDAKGRPTLAVIAQSGGIMGLLTAANEAKEIPLSYVVSTGNEAVLGVEDFLADIVEHKGTHVIAMFVEQLRHPQRFLQLAARARELGKPIILLHSGRSERSQEAAKSHTGALATNYTMMETLVSNESVILVNDIDELIDTAEVLTRFGRAPSKGTAIITDSGAFKGLALDFSEMVGLDLPEPSPDAAKAMKEVLPTFVEPSNPLDLTAQAMMDMDKMYGGTIRAMQADPGVGSVMVALLMGAPHVILGKINAVIKASQGGKVPTSLLIMGDTSPLPDEAYKVLRDAGIPLFRSPSRAMRALSHATRYGRMLNAPKSQAGKGGKAVPALPGRGVLAEYVGKSWLAAAGIPTPQGQLATNADEAVAIAEKIGYPVVLKAQAAALAHKSDVGGVMVGLSDASSVRAGWDKMVASVARHRPDIALDGILVEKMGQKGLELVVGARRDPSWGPALMVGLGGVWIEVLKDVRFIPAACDEARVIAELKSLKAAALLTGWRGSPAVDLAAVAKVVVRMGELVLAMPELTEIDVNPLVAYPDGVMALDALIVSSNEG